MKTTRLTKQQWDGIVSAVATTVMEWSEYGDPNFDRKAGVLDRAFAKLAQARRERRI